jgi:hypothetical protein
MRASASSIMVALSVMIVLSMASIGVMAAFQSHSFTSTTNYSPRQWRQGDRAAPNTDLCFHAALKHNAASAIDDKFWKVTPTDD